MSPDKFLELNSQSFFYCSKTKCRLTHAECVRRQDVIKDKKNKETNGWVRRKGGMSYDYGQCIKCKEGKINRKLAKQAEIVRVAVPDTVILPPAWDSKFDGKNQARGVL